ncbi:MAG: hypothetical protein HY961_11450 [Ignavibacteriae bacterium]|nr:hypothetical protein [Ignavibacteriota bacterium]
MKVGCGIVHGAIAGLILLPAMIYADDQAFRLVRQDATVWEIEYVPREHPFTTITIDGKSYIRFAEPTATEGRDEQTGMPALPIDAVSLGIPQDATISVELADPEYQILEHSNVAPYPSYDITDESESIEVFRRDAVAYEANVFFPTTQIQVQPPFVLRQQRITAIRIRPYQYNPRQQTLRKLVRAILRVHLKREKNFAAGSAPRNDPHFEETYKSLLLNYEEARSWRMNPAQRTLFDSSAMWFQLGVQYLKAGIVSDGWVKLSYAEMQSAGVNLTGVDLSTLKLFQRGYQLPIVVRQDTSVEFYARRNYGDSTYIDYYTDTSACWLTWGGSQGLRFESSSTTGTPTLTITSSVHTLHVETNTNFFYSASTTELVDNRDVPGEGWFWVNLDVNAESAFSFTLDSLDFASPTSTVRARFWGTSYVAPPSTPYQHRASVWVNDSLAGEFLFSQREGGVFAASIPTAWLKVGSNSLRVRNVNTGNSGSFYFDWFEIDYPRKLRAISNQLLFQSPTLAGTTTAAFVVSNFADSQIEVYDLTTRRIITNVSVSGDSSSGFTATFKDTVSGMRTYVVTCASGARSVASLRRKSFTNIRQLSAGADYIIITHKNFRSQADQLAAHRHALNGVRTVVIDVDDIYDEFNYGAKNGTKIKTFLRYARDNWLAPAPAYLLFFGDASFDLRYYFSNSIKKDFIPAYGCPSSDNWYTCFIDTLPFIPSMYVGRIPAEDATVAQSVVNKIIAYDAYTLGDWNKRFLYITGGVTPVEQSQFNYLAELSIADYIVPPPLGGVPLRVYKATSGIVDGDYKRLLMNHFKEGVNFVAFTGHSGGRVWSVDSGKPSEWENTNGRLPFIAAVSCNIGGFYASANNVLAEDFLNAENRGAIAAWASASLGYATYGSALTNYLLSNAIRDSVREFGKLTTNARYRLWFETGSGSTTVAMVNLNPLIGDPLSAFALPKKPDIAVASTDFSFSTMTPTPADSTITARIMLHNYGLVPPETLAVTVSDIFDGRTTLLLNNTKLRKIRSLDSVFVQLHVSDEIGLHTLSTTLDPLNRINEVNELNNIASRDHTVFTNTLYVVKPLNNTLVPEGVQRLVVTSPIGYDSSGFVYQFELDTVDTFDSPVLITSGSVSPGLVSGEWLTPMLQGERVFFWRARTMHGSLAGNWVASSFETSQELPASPSAIFPKVRWREHVPKQFNRDAMLNVAATDSGVTIVPRSSTFLFCRSVGNLYDHFRDYYATIIANDQVGSGYWWPTGNSFVAARVSDVSGAMDYRAFPLYYTAGSTNGGPWQADSMANFINAAPVGTYIAVATIFDGQTNVNERLRQAMDSLGATQFRSIVNGQTYAFIGRKGNGAPGMQPLEQLRTNDSSVVSMTIPNFYGAGAGSITSGGMPIAASWDSVHWRRSIELPKTNATVRMFGVRPGGTIDTLRTLPADSTDIDLSFLNALTRSPRYASLKLSCALSTTDATVTPVLSRWWLDFVPPPDLAVSAQTVGVTQNDAMHFALPVTVHNIGYAKSDSARVIVSSINKYNQRKQLAWALVDSIPVEGSQSASVSFSTSGLSQRTRLEVVVSPLHKGRDLVAENNVAYYQLLLSRAVPSIQMRVLVNGSEILDGDYIPPRPRILVQPRDVEANVAMQNIEFLLDGKMQQASVTMMKAVSGGEESQAEFLPELESGRHELKFKLAIQDELGDIDSVEYVLSVMVEKESGIRNIINYPNPFSRETYFTFVLTGSDVPDEVKVKIFTVAGRKIREMFVSQSSLQLGLNRVHWDGRDADGDEVANGYYLYQVTAHAGGAEHSAIEKLVKVK